MPPRPPWSARPASACEGGKACNCKKGKHGHMGDHGKGDHGQGCKCGKDGKCDCAEGKCNCGAGEIHRGLTMDRESSERHLEVP